MFKCDKCSLCCSHLDRSIIYADLDRGDGVCKYLKGNLCSIYENRPLLCRVDESYEMFFLDKMTREEFYELNYRSCMELKKLYQKTNIKRRITMFLNQLNQEEREIFLKLAIAVIRADEKIKESERALIAEYAHEMNIPTYDISKDVNVGPLFKIISEKSSDSVKRIFLVELTACAYADEYLAKEENDLINSMIIEFGLEKQEFSKCVKLLGNYTTAAAALSQFIKEGE